MGRILMKLVTLSFVQSVKLMRFMLISGGISIRLLTVAVAIRVNATIPIPHLANPMTKEPPPFQLLLDTTLITVVDTILLSFGNLDPFSWLLLRLHHRSLPRAAQLLLLAVRR